MQVTPTSNFLLALNGIRFIFLFSRTRKGSLTDKVCNPAVHHVKLFFLMHLLFYSSIHLYTIIILWKGFPGYHIHYLNCHYGSPVVFILFQERVKHAYEGGWVMNQKVWLYQRISSLLYANHLAFQT